jgi:hypothetical protein
MLVGVTAYQQEQAQRVIDTENGTRSPEPGHHGPLLHHRTRRHHRTRATGNLHRPNVVPWH